jgi:hypothetical protein
MLLVFKLHLNQLVDSGGLLRHVLLDEVDVVAAWSLRCLHILFV